MDNPAKTSKQVTKALREAGFDAELVKGKGYWYFSGPDAEGFKETGVLVLRVSDLTLRQWLDEFKAKKESQ